MMDGNRFAQSPYSARTQKDVAELLGVSRECVYRTEQRAMRKLRAAIKAEAAAVGVSVREWLFGETEIESCKSS